MAGPFPYHLTSNSGFARKVPISILRPGHLEKDWRKTFGMSQDDPGFDEMVRLGQEIRQRDRGDGV